MNKKVLIALCCGLALVLLVLIGMIVAKPGNKQTELKKPAETEAALSATVGTQDAPWEEAQNDKETEADAETVADEETVPDSDEDDESGTNSGTTTDKNQNTGSNTPTIPSDNVQMGTVEGEDDDGISDEEATVTTPPQGNDQEETEASKPEETKPEESKPSGGSVLGENFDITKLTYEGYNAMSGEQQKAVIELFGSPDDFMRWYKVVEAIYKAEHPDIEIGGDGNVDIG